MKGLGVRLNYLKRFVFLAALAAVLVFLSGGANALPLAIGTVRCVPSATVNHACTTATTYPTIQAAVTAALPFDVIYVGPGRYHESVTILAFNLSLLGAQAGKDARVGRYDPSKESIVDATGKGDSAIIVEAAFVVVDGFTVQGATQGNSTGIDLKGSGGGSSFTAANFAKVVNNILTNNSTGVSLNSEQFNQNVGIVIEHNLFKNNNAGTPLSSGDGIFTSGTQGAIITENAFIGNKTSAMGINNSYNVTITNNISRRDASFVIFTGTQFAQFSNNRGEDFGANGAFPGAGDAAVAVGPGNELLTISDNWLDEGKDPISNGIAFTTIFGTSPSSAILNVNNNRITRFPGNGIVAEAGMLQESSIFGNMVADNRLDGIYIDDTAINAQNSLFDNVAEGNYRFDCHDDTTGPLTAGTWNSWLHNTGSLSQPRGLCSPGRWHNDY
jgi:hypothetical protein